jgi:hypothetical protein
MLHNDYPFRQDFDILGLSASQSIFGADWSGGTGLNMVLIMK